MAEKPSKNLEVGTLEGLAWTPEAQENSLEQVYKFVSDEAQRAIAWYLSKKEPKRWGARWRCLLAIVATTVAGLIPLLAEIFAPNGPLYIRAADS